MPQDVWCRHSRVQGAPIGFTTQLTPVCTTWAVAAKQKRRPAVSALSHRRMQFVRDEPLQSKCRRHRVVLTPCPLAEFPPHTRCPLVLLYWVLNGPRCSVLFLLVGRTKIFFSPYFKPLCTHWVTLQKKVSNVPFVIQLYSVQASAVRLPVFRSLCALNKTSIMLPIFWMALQSVVVNCKIKTEVLKTHCIVHIG